MSITQTSMSYSDGEQDLLNDLLDLSLAEDLRTAGDITSAAVFSSEIGQAHIIAREQGIISGLSVVQQVYQKVDPALEVTARVCDSDSVQKNDEILIITGRLVSILTGERIALNFLGYLSGVATLTNRFQSILSQMGTTRILDTRKTIPGLRELSKKAVRDGGGVNHRMGLYDMVMLKDNHIDAAGGIKPAVQAVRAKYGTKFIVEVECRNLDDVSTAIQAGADWIMLDNMEPHLCVEALAIRQKLGSTIPLEASGDMDEEKIRNYGSIGLEYISVGKITHSVRNLNVSLRYIDLRK